MGLSSLTIYDDDGVEAHNLPNQFYKKTDLRMFKVEALENIIHEFADTYVEAVNKKYVDEPLANTVIVATDSMRSRKKVWNEFKTQSRCVNYIETRMGALLGMIYVIRKKDGVLSQEDIDFYEAMLFDDSKAEEIPCTERAIIFNVALIASRVGRAVCAILRDEPHPREIIDNMTFMDGSRPLCQIRM